MCYPGRELEGDQYIPCVSCGNTDTRRNDINETVMGENESGYETAIGTDTSGDTKQDLFEGVEGVNNGLFSAMETADNGLFDGLDEVPKMFGVYLL